MNTNPPSGSMLERDLAVRLEALLREIGWLRGWRVERMGEERDAGFDLLGSVPLPTGGRAALCVECKRELRPSAFPMLAGRKLLPPGRPGVVVRVLGLPWVSPRMAGVCAEHGWSWIDLAGNCRLDIPGVMRIEHTGNSPVHESPRPMANLGTREAGRVIRALLAPENAGFKWTQRAMQAHCKPTVSLGLVNKVVRHLKDEAFIEPSEGGGFMLVEPTRLLVAWRAAYRFDRHIRLGYFTLLQGRKLQEALAALDLRTGGHAAYAAFSAADLQAPHVRQPKTWLYLRDRDLPLFEQLVEAKPVESGENIVVLIADDDGVFYLGEGVEKRMACTNAVQTYVDLFHCGGRGEEAAEALLGQRLMPAWKALKHQ